MLCPVLGLDRCGFGAIEWDDPLRSAFVVGAVLLVAAECASRHIVGSDSERALGRLSGIYRFLRWLLSPLIPLTSLVLPRPRTADDEDPDEASPDEIDAFIDVGRREGILELDEGELVRGLVDFGDTLVRSVMTPRVDLIAGPLEGSIEEFMDLVVASGHSRLPVYKGSIDEIVGVLHVRDLMRIVRSGEGKLDDYLLPTHFVPATKNLTELLRELQERHQELAVVVDEYGGTEGVVTIEDLLEEIFGEIVDEHDEEDPPEVQLADGSWQVDGRVHMEDLATLIEAVVPEVSYETVGGLIFGVLGRVPVPGDHVEIFDLKFEVEEADSRSARRVRVSKQDPDRTPESETAPSEEQQ